MEEDKKDFKWYIIHTHSGFELKVVNSIKEEVNKKKLSADMELQQRLR